MNSPLKVFVGSWRCQRTLHSPADFQAAIELLRIHAISEGPIGDAKRFTIIGKQAIASQVAVLLGVGCPPDVAGKVTSHVVDAVDRVPRGWAFPYITEECRKVSPFIADGNAPSTVMVKLLVLWVLASVKHGGPSVVFGGGNAIDSVACCSSSIRNFACARSPYCRFGRLPRRRNRSDRATGIYQSTVEIRWRRASQT